ncbi:uncharacterized protein LOC103571171 [Microplitis demolitor]|uniref:uncharacterized protein LOC103571171 n=1 Tax=Microplitis demolitor TaxID=69319 RepID=UPI0006D4C891|nr:uncharacterized protein LOC103571171 [Microplitis demolitor]
MHACTSENDSINKSGSLYDPSDSKTDSEEESESEKVNKSKEENTMSSVECNSSLDLSIKFSSSFNVPGNSACDDKGLTTESSQLKNIKKHFCFYCKKFHTQIARHLEMKHALEEDVQEFMSYKKGSSERKRAISVIRKKGDFELLVKKNLNKGKIVVPVRRPVDKDKCLATKFAVCPACKGLYTKNNIRHHIAKCPQHENNSSRGIMTNFRIAVGRVHQKACIVLRQEVIPHMAEDDVNKNSKITDFASLYDPVHYHFLIDSIDEFAGMNKRTGHYKIAGNATEITKHIKKIGELLQAEYIIENDVEKKTKVDNFLSLCKLGFSNVINKTAMETLVARQREKVIELPSTTDILHLSQYLDALIDKYYKDLKNGIRIIHGENDEDYKNLTADEQKAAQEYVRIVIRGKLNKNVPILLTKSWYKAIKLIIRHRHNAGVSKRNPYVFGLDGLSDQSFLSATKLLNEFSKKCGADKPETLRGTPLRKHAATKCAQFGLDEANTANFAKFMGHDINIHKNVYRQPVVKTDILGISKVLERAQKPVEVSTMNDIIASESPVMYNGDTTDDPRTIDPRQLIRRQLILTTIDPSTIDPSDSEIIGKLPEHNHIANVTTIEAKKVNVQLKKKG